MRTLTSRSLALPVSACVLLLQLLCLDQVAGDFALRSAETLFYADDRDVDRTHAESEAFCASLGGVVPMAREQEVSFLRSFLPHHKVTWCYRLAGQRVESLNGSASAFVWADGSPFEGEWDEHEPNHCVHDCRLCIWRNGKFVVSDGSRAANAVCEIRLTSGALEPIERQMDSFSPADRSFLLLLSAHLRTGRVVDHLLSSKDRENGRLRSEVRDLEGLIKSQEPILRRMQRFMDTLLAELPASSPVVAAVAAADVLDAEDASFEGRW